WVSWRLGVRGYGVMAATVMSKVGSVVAVDVSRPYRPWPFGRSRVPTRLWLEPGAGKGAVRVPIPTTSDRRAPRLGDRVEVGNPSWGRPVGAWRGEASARWPAASHDAVRHRSWAPTQVLRRQPRYVQGSLLPP